MLPFLNKKVQQAGVIVKERQPDEKPEEKDESGKEAAAKDLINAIHSKDHKAAAQALSDFFELSEMEPHEEGPHIEPHSYDAQKED